MHLARKFLYVVVVLMVMVIAGAFAFRLYGNDILKWSLTPGAAFREQARQELAAYRGTTLWFARPGLRDTPADWLPPGTRRGEPGRAAIFFIHPTSFMSRDAWNAGVDDAEANDRAAIFLRGQASAFNAAGQVWAPRYRQATFGAFVTDAPDAQAALDLAYRDVETAFRSFLAQVEPGRPLILAGHSQGALHLARLLRDHVAGDRRLRRRIVAAYVVGWPISEATDLPRMGLPQCTRGEETGCLLAWASFADPADPELIEEAFDATIGFDGRSRRGTPIVCTNPLTGTADAAALASANGGTLFPSEDLTTATLEPGKVGARCEGRGYLLIGQGPDIGPYVLPGNNYHVYDYSLFWANVRADALRRLAAFAR
jgi:hypothetical protein